MANARELIENNIALAYYAAYKLSYARALEFNERVSTAMQGLVKAANRFDPDNGARFHTYALNVIQNELNMELRRMNADKRKAILVPLEHASGKECISAEDEALSRLNFKATCKALTPRERRIAAQKLCGTSQAAIAASEGISQATICRIMKNMKTKFS